jgi:prepilin-type N-terminal cleavage/methylation domain-containing protein
MKRSAFTLVEILVVIALASIIMSMVVGSLAQARNLAKRAKAEAQLRELVSAWHEYFVLEGEWPSDVDNGVDVEMTYDKLDALTDPDNADENPRGLVLLNVTLKTGESYKDPWGNVYKLSFKAPDVQNETALRLSVAFPNRKRRMMY